MNPCWTLQLNGSCLGVRVQLDRVWQSGTVLALAGFVLSLHACEFVFVYVCVRVFVYLWGAIRVWQSCSALVGARSGNLCLSDLHLPGQGELVPEGE